MDFDHRIQQMYREFDVDKVLVTSSFAATSAYFLHLISTLEPRQKFAFIDTGYHFPETLAYRDYLIERFGLDVFSVRAESWKHQFSIDDKTRSEEHTSELQSLMRISYAVFCLKKKTQKKQKNYNKQQ